MRTCDHLDDGEAEPAALAAAAFAATREPLEGPAHDVIRKSRRLVRDVHLDASIRVHRAHAYLAAAVPQSVVDEVSQRLLDADPVSLELDLTSRHPQPAIRLASPRLEARQN